MKLVFLFVGGGKDDGLQALEADYLKRLNYFLKTEVVRLKPTKLARGSAEEKCADECRSIISSLKKDDFVVLCDEAGTEFKSSVHFSDQFVKWVESGKQRLVFVIAGAYGADEFLRQRAQAKWAFSRLTFNHQMAQVFVLEQTYRAATIWKGIPYHNA